MDEKKIMELFDLPYTTQMTGDELRKGYQLIFNELNKRYFDNELPPLIIDFPEWDTFTNRGAEDIFPTEANGLFIVTPNNQPIIFLDIQDQPTDINTGTITDLHHEMIHYYCWINDITDCDGEYHNKNYKAAAEKHGCTTCKYTDEKNGYNDTVFSTKDILEIFDAITKLMES